MRPSHSLLVLGDALEAGLLSREADVSLPDGNPSCPIIRVYADSCGLKTAFLGNGGRNAATIFSLRYSSSG